MDFTEYRPEKHLNKEEENLPFLTDELEKFIKGTYPLFSHDSLKLNDEQIRRLAHLLIEFAEDLYLDIGIWKSYENHNINIFGTPLPCTLENGEQISENDPINEYRIQHFLWNIYGMLEPNLIFSPHHKDLHYFTEEITFFLNNKQSYFPKKSTIKDFLHQPEDDAYDIKRKLLWLGTKSYLFRENFRYYLNKENLKEEIPTMDDFIVQVATLWSGLGVIDILVDILNLPQTRKKDIKSWKERHLAFYLVKSVQRKKLIVTNIITNKTYHIINSTPNPPFNEGEVIFGSTIKYGDKWYWSGNQKTFKDLPESQLQEIREDFIKNTPKVVYRYDKNLLELARNRLEEMYNEFVAQWGDDMVEFSDGLSYLAYLQGKERKKYEELSPEEFEELKDKHNLKDKSPNFNIPDEVINCETGIMVFFNKVEGQELLIDFNNFKKALEKQGQNLTDEDIDYMHALIEDNSLSPDFVRKIMAKYGNRSVMKAYHVDTEECLDFLMRKYKGAFYQERYPSLTVQ